MLAAAWCAVSCDQISIDEVEVSSPVVQSFSPQSAPVGATVQVTGEFLNGVTEAYIGTQKVEIAQKVSPSRLSIKVTAGVTKGKVILVNGEGRGESADDFTCTFATPSINTELLQAQAEMGSEILLSGTDLGGVTSVLFTAEGQTEGHNATIVNSDARELVVKVPYVEAENAKITLGYFNGTGEVFTAIESAPSIKVIRYVPAFDAYAFEKTAVGRSITLTGQYLNNVDRIMVGDYEAAIFKEPAKLTFTVPAGEFKDGETTVSLKAWYFDNNESIELSPSFVVFVPFVKFWQDIRGWCEGRVAENSYASFFCPENGKLFENAKWKTDLDPVAYRINGSQWGSANLPKEGVVSDQDYYSVLPYFFFSSVSGNVLQINGPANSNGQLKNFYIGFTNAEGTATNDNRVPGANSSIPGTPIIAFRYLNPGNAVEKELIDKVLADQIDKIDEVTFPIDVANSTIAGISVTGMAGAIKSDKFCDHQTAELKDDPGYKLDAVFIVAYYNNYGYNPDQRAANIRRLGLIHVKQIDWGVISTKFGASVVTFDCYWQKYDYDYSKL